MQHGMLLDNASLTLATGAKGADKMFDHSM